MPTTIPAAWTTAKAALATLQADANTLATDLAAFEASLTTLYSLGAGDVVEWLQRQARQTRLGFAPYPALGGVQASPTYMLAVSAADATKPRDLSSVDQRPISSTTTGQANQLS